MAVAALAVAAATYTSPLAQCRPPTARARPPVAFFDGLKRAVRGDSRRRYYDDYEDEYGGFDYYRDGYRDRYMDGYYEGDGYPRGGGYWRRQAYSRRRNPDFVGAPEIRGNEGLAAGGSWPGKPDLRGVDGLADLVEYLPPEKQEAALRWCLDTDTPSVKVLVLMEQDEAFLDALDIQPDGNMLPILRERLDAQRAALGAKGIERGRYSPSYYNRGRPPPVPYAPRPPEGYGGLPPPGYDGFGPEVVDRVPPPAYGPAAYGPAEYGPAAYGPAAYGPRVPYGVRPPNSYYVSDAGYVSSALRGTDGLNHEEYRSAARPNARFYQVGE